MFTQIQKINYIPTLVLRYWFLIWGTLGKPNHARPHPPDTNELVYCFHSFLSTCKKFTSCINSFLRYWSFRNPAIWLMEIIVGHNSRIKILSDMKFAMGSHKLQGFSFQTIFRKIIVCIGESTSLKNTTTPTKHCVFGPFLPKYGQKWVYFKNWVGRGDETTLPGGAKDKCLTGIGFSLISQKQSPPKFFLYR